MPVDGRGQQRFAELRPVMAPDRSRYVYFPGTGEVSSSASPRMLSLEFTPTGPASPREGRGTPGDITFFIDGQPAGGGTLPVTIPIMMGLAAGVSVGADVGAPVTEAYRAPFRFTGTIHRVVYDVSGESIVDHEAEIIAALARQ